MTALGQFQTLIRAKMDVAGKVYSDAGNGLYQVSTVNGLLTVQGVGLKVGERVVVSNGQAVRVSRAGGAAKVYMV